MFGGCCCQGNKTYLAQKITVLRRILQNKVLVKMNIFFHLEVDCPEILSVGFSNPKNLILQPDFYIYGLDQKLSSCKLKSLHFLFKQELSSLSKFWQHNGILCRKNFSSIHTKMRENIHLQYHRNEHTLDGGSGNEWEIVKITLLIRLFQTYSKRAA